MQHELNIWKGFMKDISTGDMTFYVAVNEFAFKVGHTILFGGWNYGTWKATGEKVLVQITYLFTGQGVDHGFIVIGFKVI